MSRIQQILDKAEREGRMRRTTGLNEQPAAAPGVPPAAERAFTGGASAAPPVNRPAVTPPLHAAARAAAPASQAAPRPVVTAVPNPVVGPARAAASALNPLLVTAVQPHSGIAEQYRALRTRIAQLENGRDYRTLMVTSPTQGDGKTLTSLNLALAMAQEFQRRILLVDADLRGGSLHRLLGIPGHPGLSDVLLGTTRLEDAMIAIPEHRLTVIPAGSAVDQPTELLGSADMRRIVDILRTQFDRILFDTPPAVPLADVGVLAPMLDGVILVVRAGRTQRPAIDRAIEDLDPSRLVGLVLNDVEEPAGIYGYRDAEGQPPKAGWTRHLHRAPGAEARSR